MRNMSEALQPGSHPYSSPAFADAADAATTREVAEDTVADENLGNPYTATDDDGDTPVYALSGTDAASFIYRQRHGPVDDERSPGLRDQDDLYGHRGGPGQRGRHRRRRH